MVVWRAAEDTAVTKPTRGLGERLFVAMQYLIPQHGFLGTI